MMHSICTLECCYEPPVTGARCQALGGSHGDIIGTWLAPARSSIPLCLIRCQRSAPTCRVRGAWGALRFVALLTGLWAVYVTLQRREPHSAGSIIPPDWVLGALPALPPSRPLRCRW